MTNYVQIVADGVTTVFTANFELLLYTDVAVYVTLTGEVFDPTQIVTNYSLSFISGQSFTITFDPAPPNLSTVTIWRQTLDQIDTQFYLPQPIRGAVLDSVFHRIELVIADLQSDTAENIVNAIHYPYFETVSETIKTMPIPTTLGDIWLFNGIKWVILNIDSGGGGEGPDVALLRAQLARQVLGSDGTRIIGYNNGTGKTLHDELVALDAAVQTIPAAQIQSDWTQYGTDAVDYIKHKPSIPAAQIQSDWTQYDADAVDYIKHKPSLGGAQIIAAATDMNTIGGDSHWTVPITGMLVTDSVVITGSTLVYPVPGISYVPYVQSTGLGFFVMALSPAGDLETEGPTYPPIINYMVLRKL